MSETILKNIQFNVDRRFLGICVTFVQQKEAQVSFRNNPRYQDRSSFYLFLGMATDRKIDFSDAITRSLLKFGWKYNKQMLSRNFV